MGLIMFAFFIVANIALNNAELIHFDFWFSEGQWMSIAFACAVIGAILGN